MFQSYYSNPIQELEKKLKMKKKKYRPFPPLQDILAFKSVRGWSFWHGHLRASSSSSQSSIYWTLYKPRSEIKTCVFPPLSTLVQVERISTRLLPRFVVLLSLVGGFVCGLDAQLNGADNNKVQRVWEGTTCVEKEKRKRLDLSSSSSSRPSE
jgi:hypothetical protein